MKEQAEQIEITDDIIRCKFYEILISKDIEEQQSMGFSNIGDFLGLNNNSISEEDKSRIKRHEFLRENFVQEIKTLIRDEVSGHLLNLSCNIAYDDVSKIVKEPVIAIYYAIKANDINLVEALLTNLEVDPNTEFNEYGDKTFLEVACDMNNKEIVKLLLEKGASPISGFYKHIKLYEAKEKMGFDNIDDYSDALIRLNNNSISEEDKSRAKRHEFFRESFVKKFKAFIEDPNKDVDRLYYEAYINIFKIARNPRDFTAEAIQKGDYDLVDTLLTALNIDPNTEVYTLEGEAGSLLYFACNSNQKEIARLLIKKGANVNFDDSYKTLLYSVMEIGHPDMVEFLLENGADPNCGEEKGKSCLYIATFIKKDIAMITKLLAYGANMEFIHNEKTIFEQLVYLSRYPAEDKQNRIDIIKVFLQYGANPDVLAPNGQMIHDMAVIYEPLKAILKLESAFRKSDYKAIGAIDKKDLAAFVQWKSEIWPVIKEASKDEYIKSLLELTTFSKQVKLDSDDSIKQPLIKLREKIAKLSPSLKFQSLLKIADIIKGDVEGSITFDDELTYNTTIDLLKKNGFQVEVTGDTAAHTDSVKG